MRLWLLAAFLAVAVLADRPDQDEILKSVFRTWNNGPVRYVDDELFREEKQEETHSRSKRSVMSQAATIKVGFGSCQTPGYTGEGCIHPICPINNENIPNNVDTDGLGETIDKTYLANCTQEYLVYVDDTMSNIRFDLESEKPLNPYMAIMASDGSVRFPDSSERTPSSYQPFWSTLAPGIYKVIPSADLGTGACVMTMKARTMLNVVGGFVSYGDDQARNDFPTGFTYQGMEATAVFHGNSLRSPGRLISLAITGNDNSVYRPKPLETRYNCSYEFFRDGFICKTQGSYLYHVDGITFEGYQFRRTYGFMCLPPPPTTPPTTVTTPVPTPLAGCKNDGFQINQPDGNFTCFCQGLWQGTDCGTTLCMNGGTRRDDNTCACSTGFRGNHCQDVYCSDDQGSDFDAEHPTLTLVLRSRQYLNSVNQQVANAASNLFSTLQIEPEYLANFILVLFNNDQIIHNKRYTVFQDFINDILNIGANSTSTDGGCYDSVFSAVSSALIQYPTYKSPVYIVTDAPPKDNDVGDTVSQQDSFWRAPLHFIYVQPETQCIVNPEDPGYRKMDDISKKTSGQTFYLRNTSSTYDFVNSHMQQTVYRSHLMLSNDVQICNLQNAYQAVTIDNTIQQITVVATGENLQLVATMPHGDPFTRTELVYSDNGNFIWLLNGLQNGLWTFNVVTTSQGSACSFRIFQKDYNNLAGTQNPSYGSLFWAFTPAIDMNGYLTQPVYNFDTGIVMKLTNYPFVLPQYVTAGLNIYASRGGKQVEVYASNGIWRDGCEYNFYFPSFSCYVPNELLYFNFFGRDQEGLSIQRSGVMVCSLVQPTQNPPSECLNGGVESPNGTCFCQMGYSGQNCENIVCYNGGTAQGNKCLCTQNWGGTFCEFAKCTEKGFSPESQLKYVDMVFAVEMSQLGAAQIVFLDKYFGDLLRDIVSQDQKWIRRFVLAGYNSTWADVLAEANANDYQTVVDALHNAAISTMTDPKTDPGCGGMQVWKAFDTAVMKRDAGPGSYFELFLTTTPDNSDTAGWGQLYDYQRSMNLHINTYLGVKSSNKNPQGYYCNATDDDYYWLNILTASSAGELYASDPALTKNIMWTIPLQFYSSVVMNAYEEDCTDGRQWYFPVDAYAQTVQLDVYGQNPTVVVYDQDGNIQDQIQIVQDTFSGLLISTVMKECDDGWESYGSYCYLFNTEKLSWSDAQSFCHESGGQLADDMTDDKHNFIKQVGKVYSFWIGMFSNATTGSPTWYWDRPDGSQPVPLQTDYLFWAGGSAPTDPTLPCVLWNGANMRTDTWTATQCDFSAWSLCQKHRYDSQFRPSSRRTDVLPPGKWSVSITTNSTGMTYPSRMCGLLVRVQSELQIITGYAQSVGQDYPDQDPYRESSQNRLVTYLHSQDNEFRDPFLSMASITDAYNQTFYNAARYFERWDCAYPWVTQTFSCPNAMENGNEFQVAHSGEDSFGNMFQRLTFGHCSRTPLTCGQGGYVWNGQCICNEYWQGRYCTVPVCVNNGTLSNDDRSCNCQPGFTGFNCQFEMCDSLYPVTFTNDGKTLILLVENTIQNQGAITALANNLTGIFKNVDPSFFANYILGTFDSSLNTKYTEFETLTNLGNAIKALSPTDQGSCTMPLFSAINTFFGDVTSSYISWPNSEMIVVTAAGSAGDQKRRDDLVNLSDQRIKVSYIYNADKCGKQPTDGSVQAIARTAYTTNGNVAFMNSTQISNYLSVFLPSRYSSNTLSNPTVAGNFSCSGGDPWLVQVDSNTTALYIALTSEIGDLGAKDPKQDSIQPDILYSQDGTMLYRIITTSDPGTYSLNINSYGVCFASIWSVGGAQVSVFYAQTTSSNPSGSRQESNGHSPFAFVNNVITAHVQGAAGHRAKLQYAEIFDVDTQQIILRSELYRRDGPFPTYPNVSCQFEYVSDPFTCNTDLLAVYIYGMDETYIQFRQQFTAYCLNSTLTTQTPGTAGTTVSTPSTATTQPAATTTATSMKTGSTMPYTGTTGTTPVPTTSYGNRNLLFDVVFMIDVSQANANNYDILSKFVQTLMLSYTVAQGNVRVGILPVLPEPSCIPWAQLNSLSSQQMLVNYLNQLKDTMVTVGLFNETGQYVQPALDQAVKPDYINSGYRGNITNHLLVYLTSTTTFNDTPKTDAIRAGKQYGVITVGYGAGATDSNGLEGLSGGPSCAFTAADQNSLNRDVLTSIQNLIWNADGNGIYCGM